MSANPSNPGLSRTASPGQHVGCWNWGTEFESIPPVEMLFEVIYEDDEFLVVNKPAGLVCHPTKTDVYSSLISRVRLYLGPGSKPQLINRLDRETSGVTCVAKHEQVARAVRRLWEKRQVSKHYLAIVHGRVTQPYQLIAARLGKDDESPIAIKDRVRADGVEASTEIWLQNCFSRSISLDVAQYELMPQSPHSPELSTRTFSLLRVVPHTGRKHQIRIHLAHIGHALVGDKLYGENEDCYLALVENRLSAEHRSQLILPYHALHAAKLSFAWGTDEKVFHAEPEPWFKAFCSPTGIPD